jgi:HlyD family secretion protein
MKKFAFGLLLLALAGGAVYAFWPAGAGTGASYTLVKVEHGRLSEIVTATGVAQPRQVYTVGSALPGKVVAVLADFNQVVREGDVLLRLDDQGARERERLAALDVEAARAALKQSEASRNAADRAARRERHRAPQVRSQADIDLAEGQLRVAEAAVGSARVRLRQAEEAHRQAERGLERTVLCAPILATSPGETAAPLERSGVGKLAGAEKSVRDRRSFVVLERRVALNQQIGPAGASELFKLAGGLDRMRVLAQVVEGDIHKVRPGQRAEVTLSGGGNEEEAPFAGTVAEVRLAPSNDRGAVYYPVLIEVANRRDSSGEWVLRPGMTISVDVLRRTHESAWKVPTSALNFQPEDSVLTPEARQRRATLQQRKDRDHWRTVWVVGEDGTPSPIAVRVGGTGPGGETGIQDGQFTEVLEWGPGLPVSPRGGDESTYPSVIIGMSAPRSGALFQPPKIKF